MSRHTPAITFVKSTFSPSVIHSVNQQLLRQQPNSFSLGRKCSKQGFLRRRERGSHRPCQRPCPASLGEASGALPANPAANPPSAVHTPCAMPRSAMGKLSLWEFWRLRVNASEWEGGKGSVYLGAPALPFPLLPPQCSACSTAQSRATFGKVRLQNLQLMTQILSPH